MCKCTLPHTEEQIQNSKQDVPGYVSKPTSQTHLELEAKGGQMWTKCIVPLMIAAFLDATDRIWLAFLPICEMKLF